MEGIVKRSFNLNLNVMKVIGLYPLDKYPRFYKLYAYFMYSLAVIPASVLGFLEIFFKEDNSEESYDDPASFVIILLSPKLFSILANGYNIRKCIHYFDVELLTTFNDENLEIINNCVEGTQLFSSQDVFYPLLVGLLSYSSGKICISYHLMCGFH
jgi:hypothetical protein